MLLVSPASAGGFSTTSTTCEDHLAICFLFVSFALFLFVLPFLTNLRLNYFILIFSFFSLLNFLVIPFKKNFGGFFSD